MTTDILTSHDNKAYTGIIIHFVNANYQLKSYLLEILEFPEAHTVTNIAEELQEILKSWRLPQNKLIYWPLQQTMELTLWLLSR